MKNRILAWAFGIGLITLFAFQTTSIVNWSTKKLEYRNFKKKGPTVKIPQGTIACRLSWKLISESGKPATFKVINVMDESQSWLSIKHAEVLKELQFQFDYTELYARKIRKETDALKKKGIKSNDEYKVVFNKQIALLQRNQTKLLGVIQNQPDIYKRLNDQLQDSLKLYDQYK